jgi:hypothetical protein
MTADCLRTDRDLTGSGAAAVRRNGDRTCRPVRHAAVAVRPRSLNLSQTASERRRPELQLRGSASGRPVPDDRYRGCVRAAGPQQQRYRRSGSQRPQIGLESALCRPSASILARSSRNGRVEAVSLQQLAGKTEGVCADRILTCRGRGRHAVGAAPGGSCTQSACTSPSSISNHASLSVAAMYPSRHLNIDPAVIYQAKGNADNIKNEN